jgi:hypothetical protein
MAALGDTALKSVSKCSFTPCKLRFFDRFRFVSPSFAYFVNTLLYPMQDYLPGHRGILKQGMGYGSGS